MPIVIINSLLPEDLGAIPRLIADVKDSGAQALKCPPSNVWVLFQSVPLGHYVQENNSGSGTNEEANFPFVNIKAQAGRSPKDRKAFVMAVSDSIARGLSVPTEKVWIHYQEMSPQDVWFDGHWASP